MDLNLKDRVVLVTGASKGIGKAVVERLVIEGARIAVCARGEVALTSLSAGITDLAGEVLPIVADISTENGVRTCVQETINHFGGLDVLIHNAGGAVGHGLFSEITDVDWLLTFDINVMALVRLTRLSRMYLAQSNQARIVTIASTTASEPGSHDPHYSSAKAALLNLSKHLSNELASDGILVNAVSPGPIRSDGLELFIESLSDGNKLAAGEARLKFETELQSRIPLGSIGECSQVADIVAFLASSRSAWITGSVFRIDGGKSRGIS